jgi:hypothetical protein
MHTAKNLTRTNSWPLRQLIYENALELLNRIFDDIDISYMPLKGSYLICTGLAQALPARSMVDIDLLVRKKDFQKAINELTLHPQFRKEPPDPWFFEQPFIFTGGVRPVKLELHCQLNRNERFLLPTEQLFKRGSKQTRVRVLPSAEDALTILICHSLVHSRIGLPESVRGEIRLISSLPYFSWQNFYSLLQSTGIAPFGLALLRKYTTRKDVPIPLPKKYHWADFLFRLMPSRIRHHKLHRLFYRGFIEPFFMRSPAKLVAGWAVRTLVIHPGKKILSPGHRHTTENHHNTTANFQKR